MKSSEVCALAIQIVARIYGDTTYRMGSTDAVSWEYNNMTWYGGAWRSDCLGFVRAVLCGWNADKNAVCGGADTSKACYGFDEWTFVNTCSYHSYDFSGLSAHPCSLVMKNDPYRHVGIYVGNFQLDGKTYNVCECTSTLNGCYPTWVDPDGTRRLCMGGDLYGTPWLVWGIFNTLGTDYLLTEYDGGSAGATGFGTALSKEEAEMYTASLPEISYDQCKDLAKQFYDMPADCFACMAGWTYGEDPAGFDDYMMYLCACEPLNMFYGWGYNTAQNLANAIAGNDHGGYYSLANLTARAARLKQEESTTLGQRTLKAIFLALCNPNQLVTEVHGVGHPAQWRIIYEQTVAGVTTWALRSPYGDRTYDVTGTGIRGGMPSPVPPSRRSTPIWMYLRPYWAYNQYRYY